MIFCFILFQKFLRNKRWSPCWVWEDFGLVPLFVYFLPTADNHFVAVIVVFYGKASCQGSLLWWIFYWLVPQQTFSYLESQLSLSVYSFSDSTLANILSPQSDMCGTKFELKVEEVLFVGHPMLAYKRQDREFKVRDNQVTLLVLPGIRKFSLHYDANFYNDLFWFI